jgi:hypothetical protein
MCLLEDLRRPVDLVVLTIQEWTARQENRVHQESPAQVFSRTLP